MCPDAQIYIGRKLKNLFHLQFVWNGESYAELKVPGTFARKMCGLCGNFNGFPQDDLRTRSGTVTNSPSVFGNSWKVNTARLSITERCQCCKIWTLAQE